MSLSLTWPNLQLAWDINHFKPCLQRPVPEKSRWHRGLGTHRECRGRQNTSLVVAINMSTNKKWCEKHERDSTLEVFHYASYFSLTALQSKGFKESLKSTRFDAFVYSCAISLLSEAELESSGDQRGHVHSRPLHLSLPSCQRGTSPSPPPTGYRDLQQSALVRRKRNNNISLSVQ